MNTIKKSLVPQSLRRLRAQRTHSLFAGYLHLQQRSAELRRNTDLQPQFVKFFDRFFRVANPPLGLPYVKPFTEQKASPQNLWLNANVAGSYAPSSLRTSMPFRRVVTIENGTYSLPLDHAQKALDHLLYSTRVSVADLAIVLYRDYGFDSSIRTVTDLIGILAYEFGYSTSQEAVPHDDFNALFSTEWSDAFGLDWIENTDGGY